MCLRDSTFMSKSPSDFTNLDGSTAGSAKLLEVRCFCHPKYNLNKMLGIYIVRYDLRFFFGFQYFIDYKLIESIEKFLKFARYSGIKF